MLRQRGFKLNRRGTDFQSIKEIWEGTKKPHIEEIELDEDIED